MIISAQGLSKHYRSYDKSEGFGGAVKDLFGRRYRQVAAVNELDLTVERGEVVGLLGPNGAGKTTLLKMMTGLVVPSEGELRVLDAKPSKRQASFLRRIGFVMGNRRQLNWDLPGADSLAYQRLLYGVGEAQYQATLGRLTEMLNVGAMLRTPVRHLSLGERMKMEFIAGLVHAPEILFLDEPTLGLDLTAQQQLRRFITDYNRETSTTIILTSHYVDDIEQTCGRIVVLSHGAKVFDRNVEAIRLACADGDVVALPITPYVTIEQICGFGELVAVGTSSAVIRLSSTGRQRWDELHGGASARKNGGVPASFADLVGRLMTLND